MKEWSQQWIDKLQPGPRVRLKHPVQRGLYIVVGARSVNYYQQVKREGKVRWVKLGIAAPVTNPRRIPVTDAIRVCSGGSMKVRVPVSGRGSSPYSIGTYYKEVFKDIHQKECPRSWWNFDGQVRRYLLAVDKEGNPLTNSAAFEVQGGRKLADLRLDKVEHDHLSRLHTFVGETKGHPIAANQLIRLLRQLFSHALRREAYRGVNPIDQLTNGAPERILPYDEPERDRFVDETEMPWLLNAIDEEADEDWRDFFKLLLFTGQRKSTVMAMRWDQLRSDRWVVENNYARYQTRTKNQENLSVRLLPEAVEILKARKLTLKADDLEDSPWVFPAKSGIGGRQLENAKKNKGRFVAPRLKPKEEGYGDHIKDARKAHARICRRLEKALEKPRGTIDLTIHDYRRTLGSWLVAQGAPDVVVADVLGHKSVLSTKRYARIRKGGETTMKYATAAVTAMLKGHDPARLPAPREKSKGKKE